MKRAGLNRWPIYAQIGPFYAPKPSLGNRERKRGKFHSVLSMKNRNLPNIIENLTNCKQLFGVKCCQYICKH